MKKFISLLLVCLMVVPFGMLATTGVSAEASVWDGKSANIKWYVDNASATEFTISNASEFYGLSVLCYSTDPYACLTGDSDTKVQGDKKVYYDNNGDVIFDKTKIEGANSIAADKFAGKSVKLAADIDLAGKSFTPIGSSGSWQGMFDGQNHTISNLTVNNNEATHKSASYINKQFYFGLFALVAHANGGVKNLNIKNAVFNVEMVDTATNIYVGVVAGQAHKNGCEASNIKAEGVTVNIFGTATPTLTVYNVGAAYGTFNTAKAQTNIVVTDFSVDNKTALSPNTTSDKLSGKIETSGSGAFTNCSVTEGVYVPQTPSQPSQPDQPGDTPSTGDMTWVVAVVAAVAVMGSAVVLKKREN